MDDVGPEALEQGEHQGENGRFLRIEADADDIYPRDRILMDALPPGAADYAGAVAFADQLLRQMLRREGRAGDAFGAVAGVDEEYVH